MFTLFKGFDMPSATQPKGYFMNRPKFNCLLTFVLVVGLVLTTTYIISAQQDEGRERFRQRRQMDPEAMIPRMVERMMEELNLSDEATDFLKPKIEGIVQTRMKQSLETQELIEALRKAIELNDDVQIKEKLDFVKSKRKEHESKAEALEKELIELLTVEQEVQLTVSGIVNNDGTGFGDRRDVLFQPPGFMGGRRGGPGREGEKLIPRFDTDSDGKLNDEERKAARKYIQENMDERRGFPFPARESSEEESRAEADVAKAEEIDPYAPVSYDTKAGLYDEKVLRTLYLQFPNADWFEELEDFSRTDVEIPADLIVDGKVYPSVGVRFRGGSSMGTPVKKPFNIAIDYGDGKQRLYGYKTLNLLNCNSDPSFLREVLYYRICRQYMPAPKANFVKLVINGENWGIYANVQQFNKDFLRDWFSTKQGIRWKISPGGGGRGGGGGAGSLIWNGSEVANYESAFQLKTKNAPNAFQDLIKLCDTLNNTPDEQLEVALHPIFNIDRALWNIALDNVFLDTEGYSGRGGDYLLYQDKHGRFHILHHDSNEGFGVSGGGPSTWPRGAGLALSPVVGEDNEMRPVISRLLSIPHLRARYLAHVRTIVNEWLDWSVLAPIIEEYQSLIDAEVKADDKKLYSYDAFVNSATQDYSGGEGFGPPGGFGPPPDDFGPPSDDFGSSRGGFGRGRGGGPGGGMTPSFKRFVEERREFLLNHPEINKTTPVIKSVSTFSSTPLANEAVQIKAEIGGDVKVDSVILYYAMGSELLFESVQMFDDGGVVHEVTTERSEHNDGESGDGIYVGEIPTFPAGTEVHYYVEARSIAEVGTTHKPKALVNEANTFAPSKAEFGAFTYRVTAPIADSSPVVINELMAFNTQSLTDPQGENDDWIELYNVSDQEINLSGMYLSDNKDNLRKWAFPDNTIIPPKGYLIVWADEDGKDQPELHANFKLSKNGEAVMLIDKDERGNKILDSMEFGKQEKDIAYGRFPDGTGNFKQLIMTPGERNE
ncbi:CotH kinase family protein [bacterium]|nr:CotH kinase family protein [bacterium]